MFAAALAGVGVSLVGRAILPESAAYGLGTGLAVGIATDLPRSWHVHRARSVANVLVLGIMFAFLWVALAWLFESLR